MNVVALGMSEISVSELCYGCMRYLNTWEPKNIDDAARRNALECLDAARESGYTFFDHADIYAHGACETVFGDWLADNPAERDRIVIATKCGIIFEDKAAKLPHRYDLSAEHILASCDASLRRLRCGVIDLYQLHRPDLLIDVREAADALRQLVDAGKVRTVGVSNFRPSLVSAFRTACHAVGLECVSNQIELHPSNGHMLTDGILDQCQEHRMTPLAWSPLDGGRVLKDGDHRNDDHGGIASEFRAVGKRIGAEPADVALAYLMKHPSGVVPIVGSARPERVRSMAQAGAIALDRVDWYRLHLAARGSALA